MYWLLIANACFAFADVYISLLNIGAAATFWHAASAAIAMNLLMLILRKKYSWKDAKALASIGLLRVLVFSSLYLAYQYGKVGVVFTIIACSSLVAAGIFAPLNGEKFKPSILVSLLIAILGLVLVVRGNPSNLEIQFKTGELFALFSMFGFAYLTVLVRRSAVKVEPLMNVNYMFTWLAVGALPFLIVTDLLNILPMRYMLNGKEFIFLAIILLGGVGGHVMWVAAQKKISLKMTSLSLPIGAVLTTLLAMPVKHEYLDIWQWGGLTIVVLAIGTGAVIEKADHLKAIGE